MLIVALLCAFAAVKVGTNPQVQRPAAQFIHFYQQADDMGFFDRIIYSWLMVKTTASS
jgi:hypothetical protein